MCTGCSYPGGKSAGARNLPHTVCNAQVMSERITPPPNFMLLWGAKEKLFVSSSKVAGNFKKNCDEMGSWEYEMQGNSSR